MSWCLLVCFKIETFVQFNLVLVLLFVFGGSCSGPCSGHVQPEVTRDPVMLLAIVLSPLAFQKLQMHLSLTYLSKTMYQYFRIYLCILNWNRNPNPNLDSGTELTELQ